ncbi:MAG: hypothetical protein GY804_09435 [Alphaproteobacteria bacterium]|nr:hypothetical protein [Alphaproteobacteria bacterium]
MDILAVTIREGINIVSQTKDIEPLSDMIVKYHDLNKAVAILVKDDDEKTYNVNLIHLIIGIPGLGSTWEELENNITVGFMERYVSKLPVQKTYICKKDGNIIYNKFPQEFLSETFLKMINTEYLPSISIQRGSVNTPDDDHTGYLSQGNQDLKMTLSNIDKAKINLDNTVAVINGRLFYTIEYNDALWVLDCIDTLESYRGELTFIDFTPLNGCQLFRFNSLDYTVVNQDFDDNHCNATISMALPQNYSMEGKTPILVIEGRMFFPGEFKHNRVSLSFNLSDIPIEAMVVDDFSRNSKTSEDNFNDTDVNIPHLVQNIWGSKEDTNSFLIVVDSEILVNRRPLYNTFLKNMYLDLIYRNQSLLYRRSTRRLCNYVQDDYDGYTGLSIEYPRDQIILERNFSTILTYHSDLGDIGPNIADGDLISMIISRREDG